MIQRHPVIKKLILACCCLGLFSGCVAVPIPQLHRGVERAGHRIETTRLDFLVTGQTTKDEFIEKVGRPYLVMDEWGVMAYYWTMLAAYVPVIGYGGAGIPELDYSYLLLISYGQDGVIDRYETVRFEKTWGSGIFRSPADPPLGDKPVNQQALRWAGKSAGLGKFKLLSPPAGKSVVYVYLRSPETYVPLRLHGLFLNGQLWAEFHLAQYVAMVMPPGTHTIGFEPEIRKTDHFMHPHRQPPAPSFTTTLDTRPGQSYFLEVALVGDYPQKAVFSQLSERVSVSTLIGLTQVR